MLEKNKNFGSFGSNRQNIKAINDTYTASPFDDVLNCDGTFNVTLPLENDAIKEITVTSTNGTITLFADVTIEAPNTITTGTGETFYLARGEWWHK